MSDLDDGQVKQALMITTRQIIQLESVVRRKVQHSAIFNFISSVVASFYVFAFFLISIELFISIALAVGLTIYVYNATEHNESFHGSKINWTLLTFAVITPISVSLSVSFRRRETALSLLASLKASLFELYSVHASWDWRTVQQSSGRAASSVNWLEHSDATLTDIFEIIDLLQRYLTLPNVSRSRYVLLPPCRREAAEINELADKFLDVILYHMARITEACEILKQEGLATQESIRIREWEKFVADNIESLRMIKIYRTPQALRSFARLFCVVLPTLYAPYFADLARQVNSLAFAIILSVTTSLALAGLFEAIILMEDPFEKLNFLDGCAVEQEFNETHYTFRFSLCTDTSPLSFWTFWHKIDHWTWPANLPQRTPVQAEQELLEDAPPGSTLKEEEVHTNELVLEKKALKDLETEVRKKVQHSGLFNFSSSTLASFLVFGLHLISLESLVSIVLGITFTVYTYKATEDNHLFNGSALNWTLLSFAVITPMSASLGMSFRRREDALRCFAELRATFLPMYLAHLSWDWRKPGPKPTGRAASTVDFLKHSDTLLTNMLDIMDLLTRYLTLPNSNRSRHRFFPPCRQDAAQLLSLSAKMHDSIIQHMGAISEACEVLKQEGLPPNEASRIRQWERFILEYIEQLRMVKQYRTPQALRSFARLFSVLLPPLYAPYFSDLARQVDSLGFAITFTVITSLALTGLFETIYQMEDPFETEALLDGVRVEEEFCEVYRKRFLILRAQYFKDAPPFTWEAIKASAE